MTDKKVPKKLQTLDTNYESEDSFSDDDSIIEARPPTKTKKVDVIDPEPKKKSNWVMTPARKAAFERAKKNRDDNIARKRKGKEDTEAELQKLKTHLKNKKDAKEAKKQIQELKQLDTSSEDEAPKKKKPSKKPKKVIYYSSDSETDSDDGNHGSRKKPLQIIVNNGSGNSQPQVKPPVKKNILFI